MKETMEEQKKNQRILVLYYSQTTVTQKVAEEIQRRLSADIERIEVENPYSGTFDETIQRCMKEMETNTLPQLKPLTSDISQYDTIFLGYPVWFDAYARPMMTFIKQTDLSGKTLVPFCTFGSGGLSSSTKALKADQPDATVVNGYGVRDIRLAAMPKEVDYYLKAQRFVDEPFVPLIPYSQPTPVTEEEKDIFDAACGDYPFPLGTPLTVGKRPTNESMDYEFHVICKTPDGKEESAIVYVTVPKGQKPEFTQVAK